MKVQIRDLTFDSVRAAARHFKLSEGTVYSMLSRGRADHIGLGSGGHRENAAAINAKPFRIGEVTYPSMTAASLALGCNKKYIQDVLHKRKPGQMRKLLARMERHAALHALQERGTPH